MILLRILLPLLLLLVTPSDALAKAKKDTAYTHMVEDYFRVYEEGKDEDAYYRAAQRMKDYLKQHMNRELYYRIRAHEVLFDANLGRTYRALQKVNELLNDIEKEPGNDHYMEIVNTTLANVYELRGNFRLAEHYYNQALEKTDAKDSVSQADIMARMANFLMHHNPKKGWMWNERLGEITRHHSNPEYYKPYLVLKEQYYFFTNDAEGFRTAHNDYLDYMKQHPEMDFGQEVTEVMCEAFAHRYDKALRLVDQHQDKIADTDRPGLRIQIYKMMNRYDLAMKELVQIKVRRDSLDSQMLFDNMSAIDAQMKINDRINHIMNEGKQRLNIAMVTICVLMFIAFFLVLFIHFSRRRHTCEIEAKNKQLADALNKAQESDRMKSVFIEHVSHEIRTPLNVITGYAQIITSPSYKLSEEQQANMMASINDSTTYITDIVNELLDISQLDSKNQLTSEDKLEVNTLCRRMLKVAEKSNKGRLDIRFVTRIDDEITIVCNRIALEHVVLELLKNAVRFTQQGSVELFVSHDDHLRIMVTDTGIGIADDVQEKVFERFYKVDEFKKGFGLGLPICRKIVRMMDGEIYFDKDYNDGTRVIVDLPL